MAGPESLSGNLQAYVCNPSILDEVVSLRKEAGQYFWPHGARNITAGEILSDYTYFLSPRFQVSLFSTCALLSPRNSSPSPVPSMFNNSSNIIIQGGTFIVVNGNMVGASLGRCPINPSYRCS